METAFSAFEAYLSDNKKSNPIIRFSHSHVTITSLPFLKDILVQIVLWTCSLFILKKPHMLLPSIFFICASLYLLYHNFIGIGKCDIELTGRIVKIRNRLFVFNLIRKLWGFKKEIHFSEIKDIGFKEGFLLDRFVHTSDTRMLIYLETYKDAPLIMFQCKKEEDARLLTMALKKLVLNKEA